LGRTGRNVSVVGLGCEHLDGKPYAQVAETVGEALDRGVNILDVFMPGAEVRGHIAKALGGRRNEVMIQGHIGSTDINSQYDISRDLPVVKRFFEDHLRICGGHIELGMLFYMDTDDELAKVMDGGVADYALRLREKGDISHIGFSSHVPSVAMKAVRTGLPELMMFSVNPAFDSVPTGGDVFAVLEKGFGEGGSLYADPARAELYALCDSLGVGITAMKPLGAGRLLSADLSPFGAPLTVAQCVHYALTRPAVSSALVGCRSAAEVREATRYVGAGDDERDYAGALGSFGRAARGACYYCGHCQPCPSRIDVASTIRLLDVAKADPSGVPPTVRERYKAISEKAEPCTECGHCEARCPFGVKAPERVREAAATLG